MNNQTLIIILAVLIILSSFFSATETAFSSLNKIRLRYLANNGNSKAEKTLQLAENYTSLLSTILIGNNIVNILSASLATVLFTNLLGEKGVGVSTAVMTIVVLIFGEVTPKTVAKEIPESFAMFVTTPINILVKVMAPICFLFEKWSDFINGFFKNEDGDNFRSEEFITMVEEAQEDGDMDDHEADLLTNAIEFNDLDVREILTPRVDVIAAEVNMSQDVIEEMFRLNGFSRLPIYEGTIDNIIGVLHEKDFYYLFYKDSKKTIGDIIKPVLYTSPHVKISALLRQLQKEKTHMAVVIDEYGGTAGIITMEDILEELVGEIYDELDEIVEYYKRLNDNEYLVKGDAEIDDVFDYFDIDEDEDHNFNTVSGWVIHNIDRMPQVGDEFDYKNIHVTVTEADNKKALEVKMHFNDKKEEED